MVSQRVLLENLLEYYENRRKLVDKKIREWLNDLPALKEIVYRALEGGKRFRGVLTLLICDAFDGDLTKASEFAASIEFVHAATLLHDDVIDSHLQRRGRSSFWSVFDIHKAIMTGDFIFTYAGYRVSRISEKALAIISRAIYRTTLGILLEALPHYFPGNITSVYLEVIKLKTGELFAGAAELGALTTGDKRKMELARKYGILLGEAYQIADDIYDLRILRKTHKDIDLKPLKLALIHFMKIERKKADEIWKINDPEKILSIIENIRLEDELFDSLEKKLSELDKFIRQFPKSKYRDFIAFIPRYMVDAMLSYG